ncbi:MAG: hypothetical protein ACRCU6_03385 [Fusobacteriaceae bacterium]
MKVLNKDKSKGKTYGTMKKMKKKNRLLEEKATAERTENKRINSENRKVRRERDAGLEKISQVAIVDFVKGMLLVEIEGKVEKRALLFEKEEINKVNLKDKFPTFEVKLYGENVKVSKLKNFKDMMEELLWKIEGIL